MTVLSMAFPWRIHALPNENTEPRHGQDRPNTARSMKMSWYSMAMALCHFHAISMPFLQLQHGPGSRYLDPPGTVPVPCYFSQSSMEMAWLPAGAPWAPGQPPGAAPGYCTAPLATHCSPGVLSVSRGTHSSPWVPPSYRYSSYP